MEKQRRRRDDRRGERVQGQSLMDVTRDGFVRHLALDRWRDLQDMRETLGLDWRAAAQEAGVFPSRGAYAALWVREWRQAVLPAAADADPGRLFAAIEAAMAAALRAEEDQRSVRGDRPLEEDPEYKGFVDGIVEGLLRQAGELESL
ncbi:MAG: hypothetical protein ACE147_21875 [Candidatus Methylomirabilales bacterium]